MGKPGSVHAAERIFQAAMHGRLDSDEAALCDVVDFLNGEKSCGIPTIPMRMEWNQRELF
jgi:hypothetical protein